MYVPILSSHNLSSTTPSHAHHILSHSPTPLHSLLITYFHPLSLRNSSSSISSSFPLLSNLSNSSSPVILPTSPHTLLLSHPFTSPSQPPHTPLTYPLTSSPHILPSHLPLTIPSHLPHTPLTHPHIPPLTSSPHILPSHLPLNPLTYPLTSSHHILPSHPPLTPSPHTLPSHPPLTPGSTCNEAM